MAGFVGGAEAGEGVCVCVEHAGGVVAREGRRAGARRGGMACQRGRTLQSQRADTRVAFRSRGREGGRSRRAAVTLSTARRTPSPPPLPPLFPPPATPLRHRSGAAVTASRPAAVGPAPAGAPQGAAVGSGGGASGGGGATSPPAGVAAAAAAAVVAAAARVVGRGVVTRSSAGAATASRARCGAATASLGTRPPRRRGAPRTIGGDPGGLPRPPWDDGTPCRLPAVSNGGACVPAQRRLVERSGRSPLRRSYLPHTV